MPDTGPLADVRVVEETSGLAGGYAGFLLGALGADVVRLDTPGATQTPRERVLHRGKRSATAGAAVRRALHAGCDVALVDEAAPLPAPDDGLIACRVTAWPDAQASLPPAEPLVAAATGLQAMQWSWARRPVWLVTPLVGYMTGLLGALGTTAALFARRRGGPGQRVAVDGVRAAMALNSGTYVRGPGQAGALSQHGDPRGVYPNYGLYRAADGWLFVGALTPAFWVTLVTLVGREDLLADARLQGHPLTFGAPATRDFVRAALDPIFAARTVDAWIAALREADIPCGPVRTRAAALRDPEARALGLVVPLVDPVLGPTWQPGAPAVFSDTPLPAPRPAPRAGADDADVRGAAARWGRPAAPAAIASPRAPLDGIRVLDLTSFIAGPFCPLLLADLGADVVKVESPDGDPFRLAAYGFVGWNRGKRSLVLDLKRPGARDVFLDLARRADVVVDNFRAGVMDRLGLGWDALAAANPRLVHVSITGWGLDGPLAALPGFDPVFQARSGLMAAQGGLESPVFHMVAFNDYMAGALGALAATAALYARGRTARGQRVDVSLFRTSYVAQAAEMVLAADAAFPVGGPDYLGPSDGERLHPCADGWLCVAARTPAERAALGAAADLAALPRAEALARLAASGVPAAPCLGFDEVFTSPALRAARAIVDAVHPTLGPLEQTGLFIDLEATPGVLRRSAPRLGADGAAVLAEAGYDAARIAALVEAGVVGRP
jgi:crotonobetainyl-CoA:carnitine CoA-transferase CaiB-like acyl-CoA transferase